MNLLRMLTQDGTLLAHVENLETNLLAEGSQCRSRNAGVNGWNVFLMDRFNW